jgi:hypothetical protein
MKTTLTALFALSISTAAFADESTLGGVGESCRARSDCQSGLACMSNMCVDPNAKAPPRVVVVDHKVVTLRATRNGFIYAGTEEDEPARRRSPGLLAGGIVFTILGSGALVGGFVAMGLANNQDSNSDQREGAAKAALVLVPAGAVATVLGIGMIAVGAQRIRVSPGVGSVTLSGTF